MKKLILLTIFLTLPLFAQEQERKMDIDLAAFCQDRIETTESIEINLQKEHTCKTIKELEGTNIQPIVLNKKDQEGNLWKIRFHFGFTRTDYHKTDLHIKSDVMNVVIKNVEMHERTSAHHYNPKNWDTAQSYFQWIDEPTNTFTFSLEKNKNIFYLTIFHPKYLKSLVYTKSEVNGNTEYEFAPIAETMDFSAPIPEGSSLFYLGNTHMHLITQIGYGRQFVVFDTKKAGKLSYTIKGDIGINTGKARSLHYVPRVSWDDHIDDSPIQGINASIGHKIEYQRGGVSLFIDQKMIYSKMKHGFYDGTIDYNLVSTPTTFGIGIDVFTRKKKK